MRGFSILAWVLVSITLINLANAATIHGTVYDLSLKKLSNVRVEINTSPKQFLVAQNGSYSFNAPNGAYTIKAQLIQKNAVLAYVQENITIKQDGFYVLDLILFPDVEEGVEDLDIDVNGNVVETNNKKGILIVFAVLLVLAIAAASYYINKKQKKEPAKTKEEKIDEKREGDDLEQIIKVIRHEGGRATQKEIRKQMPLSEAKISLMIAELEHKGIVEKIKKGRGNIIILRKK